MKPIWKSRTLWLNLLALVAFILQAQFEFVLPADVQMAILAILNFVLRLDTRTGIEIP